MYVCSYFWVHRVSVAVHGLFVAACRLLSSYDAGAPDCMGSVVAARGFSCPAACGICMFPDQGLNPCALHWKVDS